MSVSGLNPSQLILEVTESTIVKDVKQASAQLAALRLLGVRVSIDDFGTGQSSLAQLQHLPVDELKIDRSFMEKLTDGPAGAAVAESVVKLGRALSLAVVVEGVETAEQVALLEEISSDPMLQGFFFAEPLTPPDLERLIAAEEEARLADRSHSLIAAGRHPSAAATDGAVTPVGPRGSVTARRRARQQRAS
jgi:EAL domain-containing protein (putative c-di-GMP-specific phosphodiesterase class I)